MKKLSAGCLLFFMFLGFATSAQCKGSREDVAMIESLVSELVRAYNQREEAALEKLWAEDGDLVAVPGKSPVTGRQAVLEEIRQNQGRDYKNGRLSVSITKITFLGKDAALVEAKNSLTGVTTPGGTVLPPISHFMILAVEKDKKAWFIDSARYFSGLPIVRPLNR